MRTAGNLCGYSLGRFISSRQGFVGTVASSSHGEILTRTTAASVPLETVVCISVHRSGQAWTEQQWPEQQWPEQQLVPSTLLDVGRALNGDLVLVSSLGSPLRTANVSVLPAENATQLFDRAAETYGVVIDGVDFGSDAEADKLPRESRFGLDRALNILRRYGTQARLIVHGRVQKIHGRGRLVVVFLSVGVVMAIIFLLAVGNTSTEGAQTTNLSHSAETSAAGESAAEPVVAEDDPIAFAIAEARAGRAFGGDVSEGSIFDGRVVSRNGDIVLIEVTITSAGETTFATLLLQKVARGWRTRDVFDAAG